MLRPISPYQRPTAEQDHEDDEALKPAVLHNAVAGLAQLPAHGPWQLGDIHIAAGTVAKTACGERGPSGSDIPLSSFQLLSPREATLLGNPPATPLKKDSLQKRRGGPSRGGLQFHVSGFLSSMGFAHTDILLVIVLRDGTSSSCPVAHLSLEVGKS